MQKPPMRERVSIWHAPRTLILLAVLPFIYEPTAQWRAVVIAILLVEVGFMVDWLHTSRAPGEDEARPMCPATHPEDDEPCLFRTPHPSEQHMDRLDRTWREVV